MGNSRVHKITNWGKEQGKSKFGSLFFDAPDASEIANRIKSAIELSEKYPSILKHLDSDMIQNGLNKKKIREENRKWEEAQSGFKQSDLFSVEAAFVPLSLTNSGPKRMPPVVLLAFILITGTIGGIKSSRNWTLCLESLSLRDFLTQHGMILPGATTICENMDSVTKPTIELIHQAQIDLASDDRLDDYSKLSGDSTRIEGNTEFPTDSGLMVAFILSILALIVGLSKSKEGSTSSKRSLKWLQSVLDCIRSFHVAISLDCGKKGAPKRRKKSYKKMIKKIRELAQRLETLLNHLNAELQDLNISPSIINRKKIILTKIEEKRFLLLQIANNAEKRVLQDKEVSREDKIYSASDEDASMIVKGSQDPIVGYKPQIMRSGEGLIVAFLLPFGNANDAGQLIKLYDSAVKKTKTTPRLVSFDDGYVSAIGREYIDNEGVSIVSFSGSKAKKELGDIYDNEEYKEARAWRSSVESTIFTIKHNHGLGRVSKRGLEDVYKECMMKVLAFNSARIDLLRQRIIDAQAA